MRSEGIADDWDLQYPQRKRNSLFEHAEYFANLADKQDNLRLLSKRLPTGRFNSRRSSLKSSLTVRRRYKIDCEELREFLTKNKFSKLNLKRCSDQDTLTLSPTLKQSQSWWCLIKILAKHFEGRKLEVSEIRQLSTIERSLLCILFNSQYYAGMNTKMTDICITHTINNIRLPARRSEEQYKFISRRLNRQTLSPHTHDTSQIDRALARVESDYADDRYGVLMLCVDRGKLYGVWHRAEVRSAVLYMKCRLKRL